MKNDQLKPGPWLTIHKELGVQPPEFDDRPLGAYIEAYAESIPDRPALQYRESGISYRELNEQANRLANSLASLGIGYDDVVGLHMPNIPQYVIAVVALSKLGAVASGVSPLLAPKEVVAQIEDANIQVLISLDALAKPMMESLESLPGCVKAVIVAGADDLRQPAAVELPSIPSAALCQTYLEFVAGAGSEFTQVDVAPDHVCFIQYTGGTTGKPKGAMLTVRGTMYTTLLANMYRSWLIGNEVVASAFPFFHIGGLAFVIWTLRFGGCALLIPDARDIDHFCEQMIAYPPTRLAAVPTLYQMIADHPLSAKIDFSGIVGAQTGAAPITGEDRKRIEEMLGGIVLSDSFGMTETGPTILLNPPDRCKPEALGIPLPAVDVRIVDVETGMREMPYGEAGEIVASSAALMKGYLNRPDETANALREWQGKTWMYSGDIGVMDEEGYVYIKDRAKDMIIVSGFKVFSVEVEDKLSVLDFVACSALIGAPDEKRAGSEIVHLYVELTPEAKGRNPDAVREEILEFCRSEMSSYKVPKFVHIVDAIPLTPVGKIDKKVLRAQLQS